METSATQDRKPLSTSTLRRVLRASQASQAQMRFFEAWAVLVYEPVVSKASQNGASLLSGSRGSVVSKQDNDTIGASNCAGYLSMVEAGADWLEVGVRGETSVMFGLADHLLTQLKIPKDRLREMVEAAVRFNAEDVTLTCRLGRLANSAPTIDCGCILHARLGIAWVDADMLIPNASGDWSTFWRHAHKLMAQEPSLHMSLSSLGSSLLPEDPEWRVSLDLLPMEGRLKKSVAVPALLGFFPLLGLHHCDELVDWLAKAKPRGFSLRLGVGAGGLTRLAAELIKPRGSDLATPELANSDRFVVSKIGNNLRQVLPTGSADVVSYTAERDGYSVVPRFLA